VNRRLAAAIVAVAVVASLVVLASFARLLVANVDGPPVVVSVVGVTDVTADCGQGTQTIWIPLFRVMARDIIVRNARDGVVLKELHVTGDIVVLVRRDGVLYGEPGSSYGPAPVDGCA